MYEELTIFDLMKPKPVDIRGICDDADSITKQVYYNGNYYQYIKRYKNYSRTVKGEAE